MNLKQTKFINEYLLNGNATTSAIKAGYSKKTAYSTGQRLLKNVEIIKEIEKSKKELANRTELKLDEVLKEVKKIAFEEGVIKDKLKALDMLMKYFNAYQNELKLVSSMSDHEVELLVDKLMNRNNDR